MTQNGVHGTRRVWVPAAFLSVFALVVAGRLVQLQVMEHDRYAAEAREELLGGDTLYAPRGTILDRNGNPLATSIDTWDIYINSRAWEDPADAGEAAGELATILGAEASTLLSTVTESDAHDVLVARDVDYEVGNLVLEAGIPGVIALSNTERIHPEGDLASTLLGIMGQDNSGLAGLEADYNDVLQGKAGRAIYERDSTGDPIPFGVRVREAPEPGRDIVLTIDRYLQQLAEQTLAAAVEDHDAEGGSILVMDPYSGEILAAATQPGLRYSSLDLSDASQLELFRNRAVTDLYEPGSVMKVITAAAAIDAGAVTPETTYVDEGVVEMFGTKIYNWEYRSYGTQTMTGVLEQSINSGAVFMAERLGPARFHQYLADFGFGRPTGIDVSGEAAGTFRTPDDPAWSPIDLATQSFGQSISVTPMQMLSAIAAAINGGTLFEPHLVKAFVDGEGNREEIEPEIIAEPITPGTSAQVREMLESVAVVNSVPLPQNYSAGGKSGTANVAIPNGYDERHVASFVGFAPAENPEIIVLVKLDENADLLTGTQAAGPIFAAFADQALAYMGVTPDGEAYVRDAE